MDQEKNTQIDSCITRRKFLFGTAAITAGTVLLPAIPGFGTEAVAAQYARYPRKLIGKLSQLKTSRPKPFKYPDKSKSATSYLFKLSEAAGGGVGKANNVVAFNALCTHMGGTLLGTYKPDDQVLGPCPFHQSTFDLTRHGMIVSGHATESLPQVLLELDGDDIYAVGLIGLIYGRYDNVKA